MANNETYTTDPLSKTVTDLLDKGEIARRIAGKKELLFQMMETRFERY